MTIPWPIRTLVIDPDSSVVIASTGFTGRELYALDDRNNHLYMVGSMGCASSLALGLALARPDLRVVVLDGDGAALMRMGNFATIGAYPAANLVHVLLDNEAHDSTGAQATVSASLEDRSSLSFNGLPGVILTVPVGSPFSRRVQLSPPAAAVKMPSASRES